MSDSVQPPSTVETVLHDLAAQSATGCLLVRDPEGDEAQVYLREGGIYAVNVPGRRAMLGVRLVSSGALTSEALAEALEVQRTELEGWRLGELLIHLGYVDASVVEASVVDHMTDALADLVGRPMAGWRFRKRKKTRQDTGPRTLVQTLFDDLRERGRVWDAILAVIGSPETAPSLPAEPKDHDALEPNERSLITKVDGRRSIAELAGECGFTLFEAGHVVVRLLRAGFLDIEGAHGGESCGSADGWAGDWSESAEAERRAAEDKTRAAAERKAEARRKAEEKARIETERRRVAAEYRRLEAERAEALELQRLAAERKQEQAERIRAAAAEREAANARRLKLLEDKRLEDAQALHQELEALAAKEAAERRAAEEAMRQAALAEEERAAALAAEAARYRAEDAEKVTAAELARVAADEVTRLAQAAAELSVGAEAERIIRADAEQRAQAGLQWTQDEVNHEQSADEAAFTAQASNFLTELTYESGVSAFVPNQAHSVEQVGLVAGSHAPQQSAPAAFDGPVETRQNDTAMLLRELSSLNFGGDDAPSAGPSPAPAPRPPARPPVPPLPVENKKRKKLFGR